MVVLRFCSKVAILSICLVGPVWAGDDLERSRPDFNVNQLTATWGLNLGGSLNTLSTEAAWAAKGAGGATIVIESALGLEERAETFNIGATYRLNGRHLFELRATDIRRSATRTIDREIEWGDYVFRAEGTVSSEFNTMFVDAVWKYDFSDSERLNTGFLVGLSILSFGVSLEGEARLEGSEGGVWVEGTAEGAEILAPLPVVGFYLDYALSPRWLLRLDSSALIEVSYSGHSGRLRQIHLACEYVASDLIGVGVVASSLGVAYSQNQEGERLAVDFSVKSFGAYLSFAF